MTHDKNAHKSFVKTSPLPSNSDPSLHCSLLTAHCSLSPTPKEAVTTVKTLASNGEYSLIEARIKTGRHHQIRAQAASHGHPLAGDIKYGAKPLPGQTRGGGFFLHAWKINFIECPDGFPQDITAPLPEAFQAKIEALFKR
jgi:23S rRNA-/tRNA-specific pseudouridylate synthase